MKKRILIIFTLFVFALINSSCDSWLDVTPQAQVNAEKLFSKPKGFENSRNVSVGFWMLPTPTVRSIHINLMSISDRLSVTGSLTRSMLSRTIRTTIIMYMLR